MKIKLIKPTKIYCFVVAAAPARGGSDVKTCGGSGTGGGGEAVALGVSARLQVSTSSREANWCGCPGSDSSACFRRSL
jgi:hypothetical protein